MRLAKITNYIPRFLVPIHYESIQIFFRFCFRVLSQKIPYFGYKVKTKVKYHKNEFKRIAGKIRRNSLPMVILLSNKYLWKTRKSLQSLSFPNVK